MPFNLKNCKTEKDNKSKKKFYTRTLVVKRRMPNPS